MRGTQGSLVCRRGEALTRCSCAEMVLVLEVSRITDRQLLLLEV